MTTNNFGSLAEERDRDFARKLYHSASLVRLASREWVVAELKELGLEADRLQELVGAVQRHRLDQLKEGLKQVEGTTPEQVFQGRF